jgi:hypothetical protein
VVCDEDEEGDKVKEDDCTSLSDCPMDLHLINYSPTN